MFALPQRPTPPGAVFRAAAVSRMLFSFDTLGTCLITRDEYSIFAARL